MDDDNVVKVYIPLEGELYGLTMDDMEIEFAERTLGVTIERGDTVHRFFIDKLAYPVDTARCKASISKSGKLILKLFKRNHLEKWSKLKA